MSKYLLGLDNGGTVIKAAVFDLDGNEIAVARGSVEMLSPERGHYQRNLQEVKDGNLKVIRDAIVKAGIQGSEIQAVAITGHGNGAYLIDKDGAPVFDGILSADSRAAEIVQKWNEDGAAQGIIPYTMQTLWPGQPPAIISWFKQNRPEVLQKARWVLQAKDYVRYLLTGEIYAERTDISGTSMYNVAGDCYDERIFSILGISEYYYLLPEVRNSSDICGYITPDIAEATGLNAGTPVAGGLFDIHAAAVATGIVEATEVPRLSVIVGTWSINQYLTREPDIGVTPFMTSISSSPGNWLIMEGSATSASNLEWFICNFLQLEKKEVCKNGKSIYDFCNAELHKTTAEDTDIIFLPFLFGSNIDSPIYGSLLNMRMRHKREHVIRAIYEGIVFSHRYHIDKLFSEYPQGMEIVLAGGGANSPEWAQMFADALQIPVVTTEVDELGALGSAMVAGVGVGLFSGLKDAADKMVHIKDRFEPNSELGQVYERKYQDYLSFVEKLAK